MNCLGRSLEGPTRKPRHASVFWAMPPVRLGLSGRNSGKTPESLSELFVEFPSRVRLGCPKPYNSRHLKAPEHFQNSLPPSTAGDASFFRSGSGEGLSEPVMEFPAALVFLIFSTHSDTQAVPHSTLHECLKALFRHPSGFKTHRHAVYHCLKQVQKLFRHASVFITCVSTR